MILCPSRSRIWPGSKGSIMPCSCAMRRIHLSLLIVIGVTPWRYCREAGVALWRPGESKLERHPQQQPVRDVADQARLHGNVGSRRTQLIFEPSPKPRHVACVVERDHQFVVQKQASAVEIG